MGLVTIASDPSANEYLTSTLVAPSAIAIKVAIDFETGVQVDPPDRTETTTGFSSDENTESGSAKDGISITLCSLEITTGAPTELTRENSIFSITAGDLAADGSGVSAELVTSSGGGAFFVPIKEIRREAVVYPVKLKDVEPSVRFLTDEV